MADELERAARDAVVVIAGLVDGARNYTWYTGTDAGTYLDQIEQQIVKLAGLLPENRVAVPGQSNTEEAGR